MQKRKVDRIYDSLKGWRWFENLSLDMRGTVCVMTARALDEKDADNREVVRYTAQIFDNRFRVGCKNFGKEVV